MRILELHDEEKPRERLLTHGVSSLTNIELLAILLHKGIKGRSVLDVSRMLLEKYDVKNLSLVSIDQLLKIKGIGLAKACSIKASLEFGRRSLYDKPSANITISNPEIAVTYIRPYLQSLQEKFFVIFLNTRKKLIHSKILFIGTIDKQLISTREVVKEALDVGAVSLIISHNHPSGETSPSEADISVTKHIIEALSLFHITLDDHIIISKNSFFSFAKEGLL